MFLISKIELEKNCYVLLPRDSETIKQALIFLLSIFMKIITELDYWNFVELSHLTRA